MDGPLNAYEKAGYSAPGIINFGLGSAGPLALKKVANYIKDGVMKLSEQDRNEETLQYGIDEGGIVVREQLANFLTRQYGEPVEKDDVFINNGSSDGLYTLLNHFFRPEQHIFVENPTFMTLTDPLIRHKKMKSIAITLEKDGMDMEALEGHVKQLPEVVLTPERPFKAAVFVMSMHHNPTGVCYSAEKCKKLVELARKYDLMVISDDVYNILNYDVSPSNPDEFLPAPKRLFAYDVKTDPDYKGHVVSLGTFSKIAAPGLKLGWYEMPPKTFGLLQTSYVIAGGRGKSCYLAYVMAEIIKSGDLDSHVQLLRKTYKESMDASVSLLEESLGKYGVSCSHPSGGCFLWLILPSGVSASKMMEVARRTESVGFIPGENTSLNRDFGNCMRLSFAFYEMPEQIKGLQGLCRVIEATLKAK